MLCSSRALGSTALRPAVLAGLTLALAVAPLAAHDFRLVEALVVLRSDGQFQADLTCDLDALALGVPWTEESAATARALRELEPEELQRRVEGLRAFFERRVRIRFDGEPAPFALSFPEYETREEHAASAPAFLGTTARLTGAIPANAATVTFFASRAFGPVLLSILDQRSLTGRRLALQPGEESPPWSPGEEEAAGTGPGAGRLEVLRRYLVLGFHHILPAGVDHVLFVLGLFLLTARWRPLAWQVTAFTLAHTVTLALSSFGVVRLSPRVVEPLIALSIAWVAIENVFTRRLHPWRPAVVFAFGLLHGLGFAGVLGELGLPQGERVTALLAFNLGVEGGQITVLALAFLVFGVWSNRSWYRRRLAIPASLAIAAIGLYWAVTRAMG
jgi:HupE / UreJ protein